MKDINNVEIKIGDIVKIENSPIKADNAIYVVAQDGTSKNYTGKDLTLYKVAKHKEGYSLSRSKYNIAFYPLCNFSNKYKFSREEMNAATIEILIKANSNAFIIVKSDDKYENEETENTYFRAEIKKDNETIEDVSYSVDEKEKMIAFFSNITLKKDETIEIVKQDHTWGYYYKDINYKLERTETVTEIQQEEIEVKQEVKEETTPDQSQQEEITEQKEVTTIERKYFPINEQLAKNSKSMWSFDSYIINSETEEYKQQIDKVYLIVDKISQNKPERLTEALNIAERYSKLYCDWINKGLSIEMMCPSIMICGAGNFPTNKKIKQNSARDKHFKDLEHINNYIDKLNNILNGKEIIKSGDSNALEKLQNKLAELEALQNTMKQANLYYKKHNTLTGFTEMKQSNINKLNNYMQDKRHERPFASYSLTNNNAKINATKQRIEQLQKAKEEGTKETIKTDICQVVENTELMRIQLLFDGKPDEETRSILKSNGFRWASSQGAWQRQLTNNARYSTKKVIEQLEKLTA